MNNLFDKFVEIRPIVVEDEPEAHSVYFKVGVQSFCISSCCENKEHAEWFSSMFKKALANMLQESGTLSPDRERGEWQPMETAHKARIIWLANESTMRLGYWMEGQQHECHGSIRGGWKDFAISEANGAPSDLGFTPIKWHTTPDLFPHKPPHTAEARHE